MEGKKRKNRDLDALEGIFDTLNEAVSMEKRSEWTYDRLYVITRRMTGMPISGGNAPGMDGILAEVEDLCQIYSDKLKQSAKALKKAEKILNGIEHQRMRVFVQMLYIDKVPKAEIMREMDMTEYSFNKCREKVEQAENMRTAIWPEEN